MGDPIGHSRSPLIHNHWFAAHGLNGTYVPLHVPVAGLEQALRALPALGFAGCNLTIPHKVIALGMVDSLDAEAARIGAVNCIVVRPDGLLHGLNTDAFGYMENLKQQAPGWAAAAAPAVVLGAGGAARAIVAGLVAQGAREVRVLNRSRAAAEALALACGPAVRVMDWNARNAALEGAGLLVNTTSLGMTGKAELDIALDALPRDAVVSDIVYAPLETPLLARARLRGHAVSDGLGMLLHQARPSFEAWFGVKVEVTPELRAKVVAALSFPVFPEVR
jgi:shikimate dehydrogenase